MVIENNLERKKYDELFDKFKKQVHLKKPRTLKGYIDLFLENFGAYYRHRFLEFCLFLMEKGYSLTSCYVEDKIYEQLKKFDKERFDYIRMLKESDFLSKIDKMTGDDFEDFICWLFYRLGYKASKTKASADQGVDLIFERGGLRTGVQVRRRKKKIGNSAVQAVFSGKFYYSCGKALVITNSYFTRAAKKLAEKCGVELWDRDKLVGFIETNKSRFNIY